MWRLKKIQTLLVQKWEKSTHFKDIHFTQFKLNYESGDLKNRS